MRFYALIVFFLALACATSAHAATTIPLTVTLSEPVNVVTTSGTPRIALDVGGVTRYASYASGTGTASLTFNYATQAGDVDLDGIAVSSPIQLNGGAIADLSGNPMVNLTFTPPNTSTVKVNYPSLGMDFVADVDGRYTLNGTVYNTLPAFLTATGGSFTRNSIGTYYDSTGTLQTATANTPRFDHDPVTNARKGILIEESRTNLLTYSSAIGGTNWNVGGTIATTPNAAVAPDGTSTATIMATSGGGNYVIAGASLTNGSVYTLSFYYKCNTGPCTTGFLYGFYDNGGSVLSQSTTSVPSTTWQRAQLTFTAPFTGSLQLRVFTNTSLGSATVAIWGAQLEQGAFPTSYIPTTTAAVTRAADVLTVPTGAWYNSSAGTYFANVGDATMSSTFGGIMGSISNSQQSLFGQNALVLAGANPFASGSRISGSPFKAAYGYQNSGLALSINGSSIYTGGAQSSTTPSSIEILGQWQGQRTTGHMRQAKYYPASVPDTQLQLLTQ